MTSRRRPLLVAALAILAALASTLGASGATTVGDLTARLDLGLNPKALPKKEFAPVALTVSGGFAATARSQPPALRELRLKLDRNLAVDLRGYPTCDSHGLLSQGTAYVDAHCRGAILGRGTGKIDIEFPNGPVPVSSKLAIVNGGVEGGIAKLFVHGHLEIPVPADIVATVEIKPIERGRFGSLVVATLPKIAGGSGSVTALRLTFARKLTGRGAARHPILAARCPQGALRTEAVASFADGKKAELALTSPCAF